MANQKISELGDGGTPGSADVVPGVKAGVTVKFTIAAIATAVSAYLALGSLATLNTVGSAQIDNDSITTAKIGDGTAGELITWGADGEATTVATGTAAQVLTSNGAGAAPTFQAGGGGGYTDEQAQDAIGAMLNASLTYTDGTPLLSLADRDYTDFTCTSAGTVCSIDVDAVGAAEIALDAVGTSEIATDGVGSAEISAGAVGTSEIATNSVGNADLRQSAALSVVGRSANSTGDIADISAGAASASVLRESGSTIGFGTIGSASITNASVTGSDIASATITGTNIHALTLNGSTYTPTLTGVANVTSSTAYQCQTTTIEVVIHVACKIEVTTTAAEATTQLGISLPVSSNLGADTDCVGVAMTTDADDPPGLVKGDATNNRCELSFSSGSSGSFTFWSVFTYEYI